MDNNIVILIVEAVSLYLLVLWAHSLRHRVGLAPFYALLGGVTAVMSWVTDAGVHVEAGGITFMVGSTVFYTSILLGVFVVYVFDGPHSTRIAIITVAGVSIMVPLIAVVLHAQMKISGHAPVGYVLVEPARKIRIGNKLYFGDDDSIVAEVIDNTTSRGRTLRFLFDGTHEEFKKGLYALGETPLPRNITRPVEPEDADRFQTIFAKNEGAVSAPAAGLHFSRELMKRMEIKGIDTAYITSHMSLGNFREIDVEDLTKHKMDSEQMSVTPETADQVNKAHDEGKSICAVGVTVMRALETVAGTSGNIKHYEGWTNKFIFPPYDFTVANALITNFHLPYSTLIMLTAAFGDYDMVMKTYEVAIKEGYKFGVYGDAMLII